MRHNEVFDADGQSIGTYQTSLSSTDGTMVLVARDERFGGGTIVLSEHETGRPESPWRLPYGELAIREAPPYSEKVPLHAYYRFWERLGANDIGIPMGAYVPTGSRTALSAGGVTDDLLREVITGSLQTDLTGRIDFDLIELSVHDGAVLLEGYQNDTQARLAAAEAVATVPGVKEIINMLVIRPSI